MGLVCVFLLDPYGFALEQQSPELELVYWNVGTYGIPSCVDDCLKKAFHCKLFGAGRSMLKVLRGPAVT